MSVETNTSNNRVLDYSYSEYASFWKDHNRKYEDAVERIALRRLTAHISGDCLEIGCGFGRLVNEYAPRCSRVLMTDSSESMLRQAEDRIRRLGLKNVTCARADLYELDKLNCRFDNAVCVRVIHHVENVPAFFRQVNLSLRDGGTFILEYANKKNTLEILRYLFHRPNIAPFDHQPGKRNDLFYNYHPAYIRDMLAENGFVIEEELTVSIFRNAFLKRLFGWRILSALEQRLQKPLARFHPGPSVFIRARKIRSVKGSGR